MAEKNQAVGLLAPQHHRVALFALLVVLRIAHEHRVALALAVASMPWRISEKNGFEMSGTDTMSFPVFSVRRFFAVEFGSYPRRSTACRTRFRVAAATTSG